MLPKIKIDLDYPDDSYTWPDDDDVLSQNFLQM